MGLKSSLNNQDAPYMAIAGMLALLLEVKDVLSFYPKHYVHFVMPYIGAGLFI